MNITVLIIFLTVLFAIILYLRLKNRSNKNQIESAEEQELNSMDFEKAFFERTQAGEKSQLLMSMASQQDCLMLRSILYAEGIPSYVEGEHMNNVYGGISGTMTTVVAIKVYILCDDYDKAIELINDSKIGDISGITIFKKEVSEEK